MLIAVHKGPPGVASHNIPYMLHRNSWSSNGTEPKNCVYVLAIYSDFQRARFTETSERNDERCLTLDRTSGYGRDRPILGRKINEAGGCQHGTRWNWANARSRRGSANV